MLNLYDSNKLVIILYESQHTYHAKYLGKLLSFSDDVCVPVPRYKHFHLFEWDDVPAMWNNWFLKDGQSSMTWLDWGWRKGLDFAQKQGYLNTYRTPEVDLWLESTMHGVFAIRVDELNNGTLAEVCLIFPRAWLICITESRKLKTPFMLNQLVTIVPEQVSPYDVTWIHGIDQWISNRHQVMRQLGSHLKLQIDPSEAQAFFNKTGEKLPGYQSSGHWGRKHTVRVILEPESEAMIQIEHDGMIAKTLKLKREEEYYFIVLEQRPIISIKIWQHDVSHAVTKNIVNIKSFKVNDQEVSSLGRFHPKPSNMVRHKYTPQDLKVKENCQVLDMDGFWEIITDGINIL